MHSLLGDPFYNDIRDAFNHHPEDPDLNIIKQIKHAKRNSDFKKLFTQYRKTNASQLREDSGQQKLKKFNELI